MRKGLWLAIVLLCASNLTAACFIADFELWNSRDLKVTDRQSFLSLEGSVGFKKQGGSPGSDVRLLQVRHALRSLQEKQDRVVTVLHMGDSHVAGDFLSDALRMNLQDAFGNAGRGLIPPPAYKYYRVSGADYEMSGAWELKNSRLDREEIYGITGVSISSEKAGAIFKIESEGADEITFHLLKDPRGGRMRVTYEGQVDEITTRGVKGLQLFSVSGNSAQIETLGDGPVSVLGIDLKVASAGVRYVNLGIPGATGEIFKRWNKPLVVSQVEALQPDLIVWNYGTNEGFDDDLDPAGYEASVKDALTLLSAAAPQADWIIVGPPDGQRRKGIGRECGDGWKIPPKLSNVKEVLQKVAEDEGHLFLDWAGMMGGSCSIRKWLDNKLAAPDHVHFTVKGYEYIGTSLAISLRDYLGLN